MFSDELRGSHIAANVPAAADFERLLRRDLTAYFTTRGIESAEITYQLLRKVPTQSGVAYPKFYIWVEVFAAGAPKTSGAVRLAAIDQEKFEVTDFVPRESILATPDRLDAIFPAALIASIKERAAQANAR